MSHHISLQTRTFTLRTRKHYTKSSLEANTAEPAANLTLIQYIESQTNLVSLGLYSGLLQNPSEQIHAIPR